jgi:hypothetical protein
MEQAASQANATSYKPGQSGNPQGPPSNKLRAERIERKAAELSAEFGGLDGLSANAVSRLLGRRLIVP